MLCCEAGIFEKLRLWESRLECDDIKLGVPAQALLEGVRDGRDNRDALETESSDLWFTSRISGSAGAERSDAERTTTMPPHRALTPEAPPLSLLARG